MAKKSKLVYIIGSIAIGVVSLITVLVVLIAGGFVNVSTTKLVLSSASKEFVFDGTEHKEESWQIVSGELKEGHTLVVITTGAQKDVGSSLNYITASVVDENEADVSDYYELEYQYGTLSVVTNTLHVVSNTLSKEYDGTPLTGEGYTLSQGTLPQGYTLNVFFSGSITDAGSTPNAFSVGVVDETGADKTASFAITTTVGSLTVTPRAIEIKTAGGEKVYDGTALTNEEYTITDEEERLLEGHTLSVTTSGSQTTAGTSENTATVSIANGEGVAVTANYAITVDAGTLEVTPRILTLTTDGGVKDYDGTPLTVGTYTLASGEAVTGHTLNVVPNGTQTEVGVSDNTAIVTVTDGENNDVTENYTLTVEAGKLTVNARLLEITTDSAKKGYDGLPLTKDTYTITRGSLAENQTETVRITGSLTSAGSAENEATAFVTDASGTDVTKNYDLQLVKGTLTVDQRLLEITTGSASKDYDGLPLTENSYELAANTPLVEGHYTLVTVTGRQDVPGESENTAIVEVKDGNGTIVTDNYAVDVIEGKLTIEKPALVVKTNSATKEYDGTPLTDVDYELVGTPSAEYPITIIVTGSQTDVGSSKNTVSVTVNGQPAANYYGIAYELGTLEVTKRVVHIQTGSDTKEYDGTPLTAWGYTHLEKEVVFGHTMNVVYTGSQTAAGTGANTAEVTVVDGTGASVASNYDLQVSAGELTVTKRHLSLQTLGASKVYDGTPLTCKKYETIGNPVLLGHSIEINIFGSQLNEGKSDNDATVAIYDSEGSVTENYEISLKLGTLTVTPLTIYLETNTKTKVYDGTPLQSVGWEEDLRFAEGSPTLIAGDEIVDTIWSSLTDVGEVANKVTLHVEREGVDVTQNYDFNVTYGRLVVLARFISVQSESASKIYDGTPLICEKWAITSITQVVEGHTVEVAVTGRRTDVGESENFIAEVLITDGENNNVSNNYDINLLLGVLVVKAPPSGSEEENTDPVIGPGMTGNDDSKTVVMRVMTQDGNPVYLRYNSYGDYQGSTWGNASEYGGKLSNTYSMNYLPSFALQEKGTSATQVTVDTLGKNNYVYPYYLVPTNGTVQTSDVYSYGDTTSIYSLSYYDYNYVYGIPLSGSTTYSAEELAYRSFVKSQYLTTFENAYPDSYEYLAQVIAEQGFRASDPDILGKVARYIQGAAKYNLDYDETIDSSFDPVYSFLTKKEGVCRHYAASATLLFRQLGIPARYTVGFMSEGPAGEWEDLTAGHAWVEVYIDGLGWVCVEVTGGSGNDFGGNDDNGGNGGMEIKPFDVYFEYNGSTFKYDEAEYGLQGLSKLTAQGYTYVCEVEGERKSLGNTTTKITSFTLFDKDGNDVTKEFAFTYKTGTLNVYCFSATVTTFGGSKIYDGKPLTNSKSYVEGLENGHIAIVTPKGTITDAGKAVNLFDIKIYDEATHEDITYMYRIHANYGTLEILPAKITVEAGSAEKVQDGTPLTANDYSFIGTLAEGDYFEEVIIEGSQAFIGYSDNVIKNVTICNEAGEDVTKNYVIVRVNGRLTVTPY